MGSEIKGAKTLVFGANPREDLRSISAVGNCVADLLMRQLMRADLLMSNNETAYER